MQGHNGHAQIKGDNLSTYEGLELIITDDCIKYKIIIYHHFEYN